MYIVRVFEGGKQYEYEFDCIEHAREFMASEKSMCMLTEYKNDTEYLIECKAERR